VENELEDLLKPEELKEIVSNLEKAKRTMEAHLKDANNAMAASNAENANLIKLKKKLEADLETLNKKLADEQRDKAAIDKVIIHPNPYPRILTICTQAKKKAEQDLKDLKANLDNVSAARGALDQSLKAAEEKLENAKVEFEQEQKTRQQLEKSKKLLETELHALQVWN
jgi:hypothetical protein